MEIATIIFLGILVLVQFGYIFYQQEGHRAEREELLDRIMSADWQTYKNTRDKTSPLPGGSFLRNYNDELKRRNKAFTGGETDK